MGSESSLLINSRDWSGINRRVMHVSRDGGATWDGRPPYYDEALREPAMHGCQAAMVSLPVASRGGDVRRILAFANPDSSRRTNLTLKVSMSDGRAWEATRVMFDGPAAYSALTVLPPLRRSARTD